MSNQHVISFFIFPVILIQTFGYNWESQYVFLIQNRAFERKSVTLPPSESINVNVTYKESLVKLIITQFFSEELLCCHVKNYNDSNQTHENQIGVAICKNSLFKTQINRMSINL